MIITRKERRTVEVFDRCACSVCKREFCDEIELQEMVHLDDVGGYGSIIGDGTRWALDICQHCLVERLGLFIEYPSAERTCLPRS